MVQKVGRANAPMQTQKCHLTFCTIVHIDPLAVVVSQVSSTLSKLVASIVSLHLYLFSFLFFNRLRHTDCQRYSDAVEISHGILESSVRQLSIPLILDLFDLLPICACVNEHLTLNHLLCAQSLDLVFRLEIHLDRVPAARHPIRQSLDFAKRDLEAIPLCLVLFTTFCNGNRVDERSVVGP